MAVVRLALAALGVAVLLGNSRADDNPLRDELLKLNSVTGDDAVREKLRALAKDKAKAKKLVAEAAAMVKEAKGDNPFKYNGAVVVARLAHFTKEYDTAEPFYKYMVETATKLKSGSKIVEANEGLIDLYFDSKKYAKAAEVCEKFVDTLGPDEVEDAKPFVLERLAQAKAKQGKFDEALRLADLLVEADGGGWYFRQTKGWVLREQGKLDAAIDAYIDSMEKIDANKGLKGETRDRFKDRTRYILTGLYVDNKQVDKAAKELQTLIKRNPENPTYKNDLGFIWCDNDLNLDESEKLIREAIDLDLKAQEKAKKEGLIETVKPNAAYADSLGWVLYKKKKYKDALAELKKAAADEDEGNHLEIWDHLADCYMALDQKKDAIATWQKALEFDDISKRDISRREAVIAKLKKEGVEPKVLPKKKDKKID
jgi:tetratricopeptide (TPR) repeat protein